MRPLSEMNNAAVHPAWQTDPALDVVPVRRSRAAGVALAALLACGSLLLFSFSRAPTAGRRGLLGRQASCRAAALPLAEVVRAWHEGLAAMAVQDCDCSTRCQAIPCAPAGAALGIVPSESEGPVLAHRQQSLGVVHPPGTWPALQPQLPPRPRLWIQVVDCLAEVVRWQLMQLPTSAEW